MCNYFTFTAWHVIYNGGRRAIQSTDLNHIYDSEILIAVYPKAWRYGTLYSKFYLEKAVKNQCHYDQITHSLILSLWVSLSDTEQWFHPSIRITELIHNFVSTPTLNMSRGWLFNQTEISNTSSPITVT